MNELELRAKWKIPEMFGTGIRHEAQKCWFWTWCDHTIKVYDDGTATESWMAFNAHTDRHQFVTHPYAPSVPHEVRPPSTEADILASDNRIIRESYLKSKEK